MSDRHGLIAHIYAPRRPAILPQERSRYYGHLLIPADARHALGGKKQFMVPLHEIDPLRAAAAVAPLVVEWKARIKAVRQGLHDPMQDEIDKLAAKYRKLHDPLDDAGARLIADAVDFVFREVGGRTAMGRAGRSPIRVATCWQALQSAACDQRHAADRGR